MVLACYNMSLPLAIAELEKVHLSNKWCPEKWSANWIGCYSPELASYCVSESIVYIRFR